MKRLLILFLFIFTAFFLFAENDSQVPRYDGGAAGGGIFIQFPVGDYSAFAKMNLGASLAGEYTLPFELGNNFDLGLALRADFAHVFPKSGTPLKADEELRAFGAFWARIPFMLGNQFFAFQPEAGAGLSTFFSKYEISGSEKNGTYLSPLISTALSLRWIPRSLQKLEVEAAPLFTIVPEKNTATMMIGLRLGAIYHFQMKNDSSAEEKKQAMLEKEKHEAELAEKERLEKEEQERLEREAEEKRRREAELAEQKRIEEERQRAEEAEKARLAKEAERQHLEEIKRAEEKRLAEEERLRQEEEARLAEEKRKAEEEAEKARLAEEERKREEEEAVRLAAELAEQERIARETEEARLAEEEKQRAEEARLAAEKTEPSLISERLKLKHILYFSKNGAVFTGLSRKEIRQNEKTIDEAVALIKQHPDCTVIIEGYAQNISGTEKENQTACMPLSLWRAEYVKKELVKRGIPEEKIETLGMGGANPLAGPNDRSNWWKNRRVEFVITYMSEVEDE